MFSAVRFENNNKPVFCWDMNNDEVTTKSGAIELAKRRKENYPDKICAVIDWDNMKIYPVEEIKQPKYNVKGLE